MIFRMLCNLFAIVAVPLEIAVENFNFKNIYDTRIRKTLVQFPLYTNKLTDYRNVI